tara:strand:- start:556 stop:720 length:165 start_codon:yes stop_codon:yes gene_type:complete
MEENNNGNILGKIFKGYIAYKVISYPFKRIKYQDNKQTYFDDLEYKERYSWEEE